MPQRESRQVRSALPLEAEWLTLGVAAKYLGIAQSTIRKWADTGQVPAYVTPGGHRRFRRSDLDGFLERSRGQAPRGPRVLVVDADSEARSLLRERLQARGCVVEEAASAEEATRVIERRPPRLLLLNVRMRRAEGWEMLRRIGEGGDGIPVLTFSGRGGGRQEPRGRTAERSFDRALERWIVAHRAGALDPVAVFLSWIGSHALVWLVLAAILALVRRRAAILLATAAAYLIASGLTTLIKAGVDRARPAQALHVHPLVHASTSSFPSGHASSSFACATVLVWAVRRLEARAALLALASAIALSRVYTGVHFPLDILAGAVLGAAVGVPVARAAAPLERRFGPLATRAGPATPPRPPTGVPRR